MMEEGYHATTQNRFYPDISNVNKNITVEAKLYHPTYVQVRLATSWTVRSSNPGGGRRDFPAPVQSGPWGHAASRAMGTDSHSWG